MIIFGLNASEHNYIADMVMPSHSIRSYIIYNYSDQMASIVNLYHSGQPQILYYVIDGLDHII